MNQRFEYENTMDHSVLYLNNKLDAMDWGSGITKHCQQYTAFLIAAGAAIPIENAMKIIGERLEQADAVIDPCAVRRQAERAYEYVTHQSVKLAHPGIEGRSKAKPAFDHKALMDLVIDLPEVDENQLREKSPAWADTASEYLSQLYAEGEKVAIFDDFIARKPTWIWEHGVDLKTPEGEGVWYLSNPVDGQWHPNPRNAGKLSMRSEESITSFRYAVLECDHETEHEGVNSLWLRYLCQLPLPIAAIYTSGNKSIHALVRVDAISKEEWDAHRHQELAESVIYGADPAALSAVRLTRLPHAKNLKRDAMQRLLFLNPTPTRRTINEL